MEQLEDFTKTYIPAPWRKQRQIIGLFALILVLIALVALLYLNISARATSVGRQIQAMQEDIDTLNLEIEDMQSNLSLILSAEEMERRAIANGFRFLDSEEVLYLEAPGYSKAETVLLAPRSERVVSSAPVMPPEYTESLFDWFYRLLIKFSVPLVKVLP